MIIHLSRLGVASVGEILEYDNELFEPEVNALFPKDRVTGLKKERTWCKLLISGIFLDLLLIQFI